MRRRLTLAVLVVSSHALVLAVCISSPTTAAASVVTEFTGGVTPGFTANAFPLDITQGPDGNVWFTEDEDPGGIAYIDSSGVVHEFTGGITPGFSADDRPTDITTGPDGNIWFTEAAPPGRIAYIDGAGVVHEFTGGVTPGFTANRSPTALTTGPDGQIWFIEERNPGAVAYIDGQGVVHEFTGGVATGFTTDAKPFGITSGPDHHVWFTEQSLSGAVAYIDGTGVVHEFRAGTTPGFTAYRAPDGITTGPDGHIWFTEQAGRGAVAYIDGRGVVHEFTGGLAPGFRANVAPSGLSAAADGNLWFTEQGQGVQAGAVARINFTAGRPNGSVTEFVAGAASGISAHENPTSITSASDGRLWLAELNPPGAIGRINGPDAVTGAVSVTSAAVTLTGTVNANGTAVSDCRFDFGTTPRYGASVPCAQTVDGGTTPVVVLATVTGLAAVTTYHYRIVVRNPFGTSNGTDQTLATALAPPATGSNPLAGTPVTPRAPQLSHLNLTPKNFRAARHGASVIASAPRRSGTTITYRASVDAITKFTVARAGPGVRQGNRCVARHRRRPERTKRCTRMTTMGGFVHAAVAGANSIRFSGRVGGRTLRPGTYTLLAIASTSGATGKPLTAPFTVLR
jgi:streptogramin lyase